MSESGRVSSGPRKAHVIEERWSEGGFHVVRHVRCRCDWRAEHYSAAALREAFAAHKAEADVSAPARVPSGS